ncbi:MAG: DoxX family rane protein [Candidatus Magasanikbacteria bacterium]|nr:DoxX family rane protein [Candidatus Magasanikbacteria bacterium]
MENKLAHWALRLAIFGEFVGHGVFAIQGKAQWIKWIQEILQTDAVLAGKILLAIGIMDLIVALIILVKPVRGVLAWAAVWGFWTAILRPLVGESFWDFVERWANWGAPLALLLLRGWPKSWREWVR